MAIQLTQQEQIQTSSPGRRLFSVAEYQRMGEVGILGDDERVELIEGDILKMSPIGSHHAACVMRLTMLLAQSVGRAAIVDVQGPIQLDGRSEPEPDLTLLAPRADYYAEALPMPEQILLLIEVSDTTLSYDRGRKVPLYARSGIPVVWIVNLNNSNIEVYSNPLEGKYQSVVKLKRGQTLTVPGLEGVSIKVDDVLG